MQLKRMFSLAEARGTRNYIDSQKKYEIVRTFLYFALSLSLFMAGVIQTGERANILSIVAVLGCLPASKSAVSAIMFLRFKSLSTQAADEIGRHSQGLACLYDMVFTSYKKNYCVSHLAVCGNTVCGYVEQDMEERHSPEFNENAFYEHVGNILNMDGHRDVTVKVFKNLQKYTERLEQMKALEAEPARSQAVINTLKSVVL